MNEKLAGVHHCHPDNVTIPDGIPLDGSMLDPTIPALEIVKDLFLTDIDKDKKVIAIEKLGALVSVTFDRVSQRDAPYDSRWKEAYYERLKAPSLGQSHQGLGNTRTGSESFMSRQEFGLNGVDDPELTLQGGAAASDAITLGIAGRQVEDITGDAFVMPEVAKEKDPALGEFAEVEVRGNKVSAKIDTGKLKWKLQSLPEKGTLDAYDGSECQSAILRGEGRVAHFEGRDVSCVPMTAPDGRVFYIWVAQLPADYVPKRYGMVADASKMIAGYERQKSNRAVETVGVRMVPAVQVSWKDTMPEIVAANPILDEAEQEIKLAIDYTGARAAAKTTLTMRGGPITPQGRFTFGDKGPVMYWFTSEKGNAPFATTFTTPEAWLTSEQSADFSDSAFGV